MRITLLLAAALLSCACRSQRRPESKPPRVEWRSVGSWSGHGNSQTDSFEIGYNDVRLRWVTKNEKPAGTGKFHVTVNSAVSGRELAQAIDTRGNGHGTTYVGVDPHYSYLVIESSNLDWWVSVEEPTVIDQEAPKSPSPLDTSRRP
jgi:hypothetical protein